MGASVKWGIGRFIVLSLLVCFGTTAAQATECTGITLSTNISVSSNEVLIIAQWTLNPCGLLYQVVHVENGQIVSSTTVPHPIAVISLQGTFCSENSVIVSTTTLPGSGSFPNVSVDFAIGANGSTEVQNLRFNEFFNRFEWDPPQAAVSCNNSLRYEVNFENDNVRETAIVTNTSFQIPDHPCTMNVINVTTLVGFNISRSLPEFGFAQSPVSRLPPWHIATIPGVNNAAVLWEVRYEPNNVCEIRGLQFHLVSNATQEERFINATLNANSTLIDVTLESLQPNSNYTYRVCYLLAWSNWTFCSHWVQFTTLPGNVTVPSASLWAELTSNGFVVFWDNNSTDMVTGYTLRIQPLGPVHFVPSDCLFDLYSIERFFNGSGAFSYNMTYAEPSFNYSIQLQTHIDGFNSTNGTSREIWVVTREGVPGDLSVRSSYLGAPSSPYDVTLRADWNIPCDINGKVRRFVYNLTGTLTLRSNVLCRDVVIGAGAIEVSGYLEYQERFTILVPDILPSFNYTLWVTAQTESWNTTSALDVGLAPQAYTSSDWKCSTWTYD